MAEQVTAAAMEAGIQLSEFVELDERPGTFSSIPADLHPDVYRQLESTYPSGLYSHQVNAIQTAIDGNDVCLATPTASGKSLVFMTVAADLALLEKRKRVLALYPIKALIQDQKAKWQAMFTPLRINVGFIDGSVDPSQRPAVLRNSQIVLMTPDVLHAWLMNNLGNSEVVKFVENLDLLILDEAHTYTGVFGSNMAFLIRRLMAVSSLARIISSTATIQSPSEFIEMLTGRQPVVFDESSDGTPTPSKRIYLADSAGSKFSELTKFIVELSKRHIGKFIAFGDSRKLVENVVASTRRIESQDDTIDGDLEKELKILEIPTDPSILPYRAGYEEEDRRKIQTGLESGELRGVVATSGLELGIDIGEINTVVLLGTPPTIQSFRQRLGRVGRKEPGICVLVDTKGLVGTLRGGLKEYLEKRPERAWLYLDNRYIQYVHALCAGVEQQTARKFDFMPFNTLPTGFLDFLNNELHQSDSLPDDLFSLKQRAQAGPHFEFPLRSGVEKNYVVRHQQGPNITPLGRLTESQMFREGYPGAVYYYIAKPYRVYSVNSKNGEIKVKRDKFYTTRPLVQNTVFPKFPNGVFKMQKSDVAFVAEAELQVSERILGFQEIRGGTRTSHNYEPGSEFRQNPLYRVFETTGVCWCVPDKPELMNETIPTAIMEAFCLNYGIHTRDLGIGIFHSNCSPFGGLNCKGFCIYDATNGSLRLTEQLGDSFDEILSETIVLIESQEEYDSNLVSQINELRSIYSLMELWSFDSTHLSNPTIDHSIEWVEVFAVGEKVLHKNNGQLQEMYVCGHRYTPAGVMYLLSPGENGSRISTRADQVLAGNDNPQTVKFNLYTGEIKK